jgi:excinuclease ABC subunit A
LSKYYHNTGAKTGRFGLLGGDLKRLSGVEMIDQNPIGRSSRSNPVTYIKAYDEIRKLFAEQPASKLNNFRPGHFSFNIDGGRCEECLGEGSIKVEMQFMADVDLICENCQGKRFKEEILEITYRGKNIHDILELTVREAVDFFTEDKNNLGAKIIEKLMTLDEVGLDYIKLGQSSSTLSGGESQRVKLASFLGREKASQSTLFIFDEPTTGLHFHDIKKLLKAFRSLMDRGNTVLVVEHNQEVIKTADWIIDLGPGGGENGGLLVYEGTPEGLVSCGKSFTGKYLREKLAKKNITGKTL